MTDLDMFVDYKGKIKNLKKKIKQIKNEMKKIYLGTDRQVQPNDFYDFI